MSRLEDLQPNTAMRGILPDALVTVVSVQWFGSEALELTYKNAAGKVANELTPKRRPTDSHGELPFLRSSNRADNSDSLRQLPGALCRVLRDQEEAKPRPSTLRNATCVAIH